MNGSERRQYPRYEVEIGATIYTKDEKIPATMTDINEGGLGMISEKVIMPGTKVYLSLKFIDEYAIKGIVKWSSQLYKDRNIFYRTGIEVENIVWTDLKAIGFVEGTELIAKILSETGKTNKKSYKQDKTAHGRYSSAADSNIP